VLFEESALPAQLSTQWSMKLAISTVETESLILASNVTIATLSQETGVQVPVYMKSTVGMESCPQLKIVTTTIRSKMMDVPFVKLRTGIYV